jgi:hypothetical protein
MRPKNNSKPTISGQQSGQPMTGAAWIDNSPTIPAIAPGGNPPPEAPPFCATDAPGPTLVAPVPPAPPIVGAVDAVVGSDVDGAPVCPCWSGAGNPESVVVELTPDPAGPRDSVGLVPSPALPAPLSADCPWLAEVDWASGFSVLVPAGLGCVVGEGVGEGAGAGCGEVLGGCVAAGGVVAGAGVVFGVFVVRSGLGEVCRLVVGVGLP